MTSLVRALTAAALALTACGPTPAPEQSSHPVAAPEAAAPAAEFLVRFKPPHPLAEAQALEAAGRCEEAESLARETLAARADLSGLCFARFTMAGAEIVLKSCAALDLEDMAAFQSQWTERFATMEGVEYADPNFNASLVECAE